MNGNKNTTCTVTMVFNSSEKRLEWLTESLQSDVLDVSDLSVENFYNQPMAENIVIKLEKDIKKETIEQQTDGQLKLPFGRPLNCS